MGRSDAWPRIAILGYLLISPWSQPTALVAQRCQEVSLRGFEVGDILTGCYAAIFGHHLEFHSGHELSDLAKRLERTARRREQHRFRAAHSEQLLLQSMLDALLGQSPIQDRLLESDFEDNPYLQLGNLVLEIQKALIFNLTRPSFDLATTTNRELQANPSMSTLHLLYWTYAAVAQLRGIEEGWINWRQLAPLLANARKVLKKWIKHRSERQWRLDWIEASVHRAKGRWEQALTRYGQSIEGALRSGHVHDAALICEHASETSRLAGKPWASQIFFEEALRHYRRWGATAKVSQMQPNQENRSVAQLSLELQTLTRASQVLSQQIHLQELTKALLQLAMNNAGAQHGRLVLHQGDSWEIYAAASAEELHLLEPEIALDSEQTLVPVNLIKECIRSRESLLLNDAQTSRFRDDPYFSTANKRSVICLPLQSNQRLAGLIYLENNLAAGLFTQPRLEVLQTLAAQMAISLETARHFQQLQDQHRQILSERESRHDEAMRAQSLQARKDALASFLAIASHDLKNPLASILLWNRQIVRHNDPEIERATHSIETACRRASSLVSTYLDVVASETEGSIRLQRQHCDLTALIEDEIDFQLHCLPVEQRGLAGLAWDLEAVEAFVDAERIRQVVGNLVSNALKYCPIGTPLEVILTEDKAARTIRLEVKDEGPGIAEELQAALFQPFERRIHTSPGSGLGLWICRLIVEAHAGQLGLVSKTGGGSLFWVSIPAH